MRIKHNMSKTIDHSNLFLHVLNVINHGEQNVTLIFKGHSNNEIALKSRCHANY